MMQRFTLIHDGSIQGWQAAYLAFHVAVRLGAPLLVILFDSITDEDLILQSAAQVGVGGRAAGVAIETRLVEDFSVDVLSEITGEFDGLFIPHRLIPDKGTAQRFLGALSCPIWIVSKETETYDMAVLVNDLVTDAAMIDYATSLSTRMQQSLTGLVRETQSMIDYATSLSTRMQQSLTGLVRETELEVPAGTKAAIPWISLANFTPDEFTPTIDRLGASLLFIPISNLSLVNDLNINFIVHPGSKDA